jgi:hypothetical protein
MAAIGYMAAAGFSLPWKGAPFLGQLLPRDQRNASCIFEVPSRGRLYFTLFTVRVRPAAAIRLVITHESHVDTSRGVS